MRQNLRKVADIENIKLIENKYSIFKLVFKVFVTNNILHFYEYFVKCFSALKKEFIFFALFDLEKEESTVIDEIKQTKLLFNIISFFIILKISFNELLYGSNKTNIIEELRIFSILFFSFIGLNLFIVFGRLFLYNAKFKDGIERDGIFIRVYNFLFLFSSLMLIFLFSWENVIVLLIIIIILLLIFTFELLIKDTNSKNKFVNYLLFIVLSTLFYCFYILLYAVILKIK